MTSYTVTSTPQTVAPAGVDMTFTARGIDVITLAWTEPSGQAVRHRLFPSSVLRFRTQSAVTATAPTSTVMDADPDTHLGPDWVVTGGTP